MTRRSDREMQADAFNRLSSAVERLERTMRREPKRIGSESTPRRLTFEVMAAAVPGLASQFKTRVPGAFWAQEIREGKNRPVAVISCPCGEQPESEMAVPVSCECGRAFVFDGQHVHVAFSPKPPELVEA